MTREVLETRGGVNYELEVRTPDLTVLWYRKGPLDGWHEGGRYLTVVQARQSVVDRHDSWTLHER